MTHTSPSNQQNSEPLASWDLSHQLDAALERTKDRIGTYILTVLLCLVLTMIGIVLVIMLGIASYLTYETTNDYILTGIVAGITIIAYLLLLSVASTLISISTTKALIDQEKKKPIEILQESKNLVVGYWWFNFLLGLFMIGMIIWGLFSFGLVLIVWIVWATFPVIVYLKQERKGLDNLWASKAMVNQKFWGVLGRLVLVNGIMAAISFYLQANSEQYPILLLVYFVFSIVSTPFFISFQYEMYRGLEVPEKVKPSYGWIFISVIGWLLLFATFAIAIFAMAELLPTMMKEREIRKTYPQEFQYEEDLPLDIGEFEEQLQQRIPLETNEI